MDRDEMRTEHGEYKKGEIPKCAIEPCPVCGAEAELWLFSDDFKNGPINKLMMCTNGEKFGLLLLALRRRGRDSNPR